jgi:hypothetical protein
MLSPETYHKVMNRYGQSWEAWERHFGHTNQLGKFFTYILGLNIIKFDEEVLHTPDNKTVEEWIKEKYGDEALDLVKKLIKISDNEAID